MKRFSSFIAALILTSLPVGAVEIRTHPKYGPNANRIYLSHEYFRKNPAPDFWALMPYYVNQQTASACSVASVTMILNAIRAPENLTSTVELLTQESVLKLTGNPKWSKAVGKSGGGATLDELAIYFKEALSKLKLKDWVVEAIHANSTPDFERKMREIFAKNEASDRNFILANYLQGELTGDPEGAIGHLAPLAAYDSGNDKVLVLDPDRQYYEPYWSPAKALLRAMNTVDKVSGKTRGFLWVYFNPSLSAK